MIGGRCKHGNVFSRAVLIGRVTCSIRISLSDFSRWFSDFLARFFSKKPSYLLERASTFHMFATQTCCIGTTLFARFASQNSDRINPSRTFRFAKHAVRARLFHNRGTTKCQKISGGYGGGDTPLPLPNRAVKPTRADGTAGVTLWESRSLPDLYYAIPASAGFCVFTDSTAPCRFGRIPRQDLRDDPVQVLSTPHR